MNIRTIEWENNKVKLIDQTKLPQRLEYLYIDELKDLWQAIKLLKVRGAPALGAAGALGVYLGIRNSKANNFMQFSKDLERVSSYLASSRPTARNLFWAIDRMHEVVFENSDMSVPKLKELLFEEADKIIKEDMASCRKIGFYGSRVIKDKDAVLTICNAGILATIDYGTALGVIYRAKEDNKEIRVFSCETRPLLQGSRLTAWELKKVGVDVTVICDNMAATLMQKGKINVVITGADRIAANGDSANKIGTFSLAVLAKYHNIPFYVAAPVSTFDLTLKSGKEIPIEERNPREIEELLFKKRVAPIGAKVFNPAFDVTPHNLITGLITDKGIIRPQYIKNIDRVVSLSAGRQVGSR
ncbi:MAG: S-methyl-5-thioribose-1-phosphate isomerase [Candidatus Omnitrophica bacterium]|nr:S-methyl-5-thioribose-1-phosphate isomerase [Candidatus Omnitrophota bacterium]